MKRTIIVLLAVILILSCFAFAKAGSLLYYYTDLDWFSIQSAEKAAIPAGLTEREIEIYRAGYANGHYDALNPAYISGMYVINTKTKKFHLSNCMATLTIAPENREHSVHTPKELINEGFKPCGQCNPER